MGDGDSGVMASAPSAYIFDRDWRLVDWTVDQGDESSLGELWCSIETRESESPGVLAEQGYLRTQRGLILVWLLPT